MCVSVHCTSALSECSLLPKVLRISWSFLHFTLLSKYGTSGYAKKYTSSQKANIYSFKEFKKNDEITVHSWHLFFKPKTGPSKLFKITKEQN